MEDNNLYSEVDTELKGDKNRETNNDKISILRIWSTQLFKPSLQSFNNSSQYK